MSTEESQRLKDQTRCICLQSVKCSQKILQPSPSGSLFLGTFHFMRRDSTKFLQTQVGSVRQISMTTHTIYTQDKGVAQLTINVFTTFNKVVEGSQQACQLSIRSDRTAFLAPLNGLMLNAAELLSSDSGLFLGFYIFSCQCFSSSILELLTIPVSAILSLSSCIALFYVLSHSPFSQLGNFHGSLSQGYAAGPYQNYIKISKTLNHIQLNPQDKSYGCHQMIQIETGA